MLALAMSPKFKMRIGVVTFKLPLVHFEVDPFVEADQSDVKELIEILDQHISTPFALISHRAQGASWDPTVLEHVGLPRQLRALAMVSESAQARRMHEDLEQYLIKHAGLEHVAAFSDLESAKRWCLEKLAQSTRAL